MNIPQEIERLAKLRTDGLLSEEEFTRAKAKLLDDMEATQAPTPMGFTSNTDPTFNNKSTLDVNQWAMFIHLSQFAGYCVPFLGFVAPIVLWQIKKDESPIIDQHGKNVTNWMISAVIYAVICLPLMLIIIGVPMFFALMIVSAVFAVVAAVKANNGEVWTYPLAIRFLK